jgi:hypothetical protein
MKRGHPAATLAAGLFGATIAVMANLTSVWFSPDFGGLWLFGIGLASTLIQMPVKSNSPAIQSPDGFRTASHTPVRESSVDIQRLISVINPIESNPKETKR